MPRPQVRLVFCTVIGLALLSLSSCDDGPTAPTPGTATPPVGTPVTTVSLELEAPPSIAPDSSVQLTVRAVKSDGSREDVTSRAAWTSSDTRVLQVSNDGAAAARARGESRVTARHEGRTIATTIFVLPDGTFRLSGQITESGLSVSGARLEVIAGTGQGLSATSNFNGQYALYGVAGPITLHGKKQGYANLIRNVTADAHATLNMDMSLEKPRVTLAGPYTLTLTAGSCASVLPEAARRRTYDAVVEQRGAELTVRLSGADFIVTNGRGNSFRGTYLPDDRINFTIGESSFYYYYYSNLQEDLVERLDTSSTLVVNGGVLAVLDSDLIIRGTIHGVFGMSARTAPPFWPYSTSCTSSSHRFELRRR